MLLCREGGIRHFEYGQLVMQFATPEPEEEEEHEPRIEGFAMPSPAVLHVPDVDDPDFDGDPDDEDGMKHPGYRAIFGKKRPTFKKPPPRTSEA